MSRRTLGATALAAALALSVALVALKSPHEVRVSVPTERPEVVCLAIDICPTLPPPELPVTTTTLEISQISGAGAPALGGDNSRQEQLVHSAPAPVVPSWPASLQPCGGPYPPCDVAWRESKGHYEVVSPDGIYHGKWQFSQSTWDANAARAGREDLVGVPPEQASPADQDAMAAHLWDGGAGCSHWGAC